MKTKFFFFTTLAVAALLITACSISITTKINADSTGEIGFVYKLTKDDLSQVGTYGLNADTICADMQSQGGTMPADYSFKQETHGDETWCVASKSFSSLEDLKTEISGEGFTVNTLEISGDILTFDATADMTSTDTSSMPLSITITYDLTVPGKITNHNATKVSGTTASWNLALGATTSMHLVSNLKAPEPTKAPANKKDTSGGSKDSNGGSDGGGKTSIKDTLQKYWWAIAIGLSCCCLIVIGVVVVVFVVMRKKKA